MSGQMKQQQVQQQQVIQQQQQVEQQHQHAQSQPDQQHDEYRDALLRLVKHTRDQVSRSFSVPQSDIDQLFKRILEDLDARRSYIFLPPEGPTGGGADPQVCGTCLRPY